MHPYAHLIKHAVDVIIREKKNMSAPVIIAPITLVAAKVIASKITAARIVPKIPVIIPFKAEQIHLHLLPDSDTAEAKYVTPRYTIATPNNTHKNAGVTVIVAVTVSKVATTPSMMLAITARTTQLNLQLHT